MVGWLDGWLDSWMDGWMDGLRWWRWWRWSARSDLDWYVLLHSTSVEGKSGCLQRNGGGDHKWGKSNVGG